jgi:hypothetical protein
MTEEAATNFEEWALIELFGHQKLAGKVTEAPIGGGQLLRIDVPDENGNTRFTTFKNIRAVYGLTPVTRQTAIAAAANITAEPIQPYDIIKRVQSDQHFLEHGDEGNGD